MTFRRWKVFVCLGLLAFLVSTLNAVAQTSTGEMSITVLDPTGAAVPGAAITLKGSDTGNVVRTLQTNGEGLAVAPLLEPETYDVEVSAAGFKRVDRTRIPVSVGQTVDLRIPLETGSTQQYVVVSGSAPLIEDKASTLTQVVSQREMLAVPLNGRSYLSVANLSPGAVPTVGGKDDSFAAYGNSGLQNAFLLDGARNVNYMRGLDTQQRDMVRPPLDTLQEFSVQTSNYSAEYGASAGAVVNAITRSGTNDLHGSAYEFFENDRMNANDFFALAGSQPLLVQNQFGGSLGGPLRKNRAWFFAGYERVDNHNDLPQVSTVPSLANRNGNFGSTPIYNPFTTVPNPVPGGTGDVRTQFPNNIIPASDFSPTTQQLLDAYPAPNVPGSTTQYTYNSPQISTTDNGVVRGDLQISSKDSMFGRYSQDHESVLAAAALPLPTETPVARTVDSTGVGYGYTRVFGPTLVNEVRFAWTRIHLVEDATQPLNAIVPGSLDPAVKSSIPQFTITGFAEIGLQPSCCSNSPINKTGAAWDISDNVSKTIGRHSLRTGGEVLLLRPDTESALNGRGVFGFTGVFSQNPQSRSTSGSPIADFLLGTANTVTTGTIAQFAQRAWYLGGYFQDDWTVSDRLTLNLGVRYEYQSPFIETQNRMSNFITDPGDPLFGHMILAGDPRKPRGLVTASSINLGPRIGFAYRVPDVKDLAVRGSYGIFYAQDPGNGVSTYMTANPPFYSYGGLSIVSDQLNPSSGFLVVPGATITRPPPINPSTFQLNPSSTTALQSWSDHMSIPYVQEWNLTVEKQLPWGIAWETSYVGNKSTHLWSTAQGNQPLTNGPGSPTTRRPLAQYTVAGVSRTYPYGIGNYNGISTKGEKRVGGGLSFLAAFTYGRMIDLQDYSGGGCDIGYSCGGGGDNPQNAYNIAAQRGPSDNNVQRRFSLGGEWQLPFGQGRSWAGTGWPSRIAGGWAIATIYQYETGIPFTPVLSFDNANAGNTSWPNRICNGNISNPSVNAWFNASCFVSPAEYQFGNTGRNVLIAPGVDDLDLAVHRDFHFSVEKPLVLQFRAESFNLPNHPQFRQPGYTVGTPTFGVVTATSIPNRQMQLAVRLSF